MSEIDPTQIDPSGVQWKLQHGVQLSPAEMDVAARLGLLSATEVSGPAVELSPQEPEAPTTPPAPAGPEYGSLEEPVFIRKDELADWVERELSPKLVAIGDRLSALEDTVRGLASLAAEHSNATNESVAANHARAEELSTRLTKLEQLGDLSEKFAEVEHMAELLRPLAKAQVHGA